LYFPFLPKILLLPNEKRYIILSAVSDMLHLKA
jgi:hypothetical protein